MSQFVANGDNDSAANKRHKNKNTDGNESKVNMSVQWSEQIYEKQKRPTLRNSHNVCSDSKHKNMYLFGGRSKGGANNHLYCLSNESLDQGWQLLEPSGTIPAPRKSAALAYCAGYLYLFGGNYKDQLLSDFYAFRIGKQTTAFFCFFPFVAIILFSTIFLFKNVFQITFFIIFYVLHFIL